MWLEAVRETRVFLGANCQCLTRVGKGCSHGPWSGSAVSSVGFHPLCRVVCASVPPAPPPTPRAGPESLLTCSTLPLLPMLCALPPDMVFTTPALA